MPLLDPNGNAVTSESLKEQEKESEQNKQDEQEEQKEPEYAPLVRAYRKKLRDIGEKIFKRANLLDVELTQEQAYKIIGFLEDTSVNLLFKKLHELEVDIDEIFTEEIQHQLENTITFEKKVQEYSEDDLEEIEQANKLKAK